MGLNIFLTLAKQRAAKQQAASDLGHIDLHLFFLPSPMKATSSLFFPPNLAMEGPWAVSVFSDLEPLQNTNTNSSLDPSPLGPPPSAS